MTEPAPSDAFELTGEMLALGGGDAGAQNACIACHGLRGEGNGNDVPGLAGMDRGYFLRQMELFDVGLRRHKQMRQISRALDWDARQKLSIYYSAMAIPATAGRWGAAGCAQGAVKLYHAGAPARGIPACADCHGADGAGQGGGNPALAGQPAPYIAAQLRQWRSGERYGDADRVMAEISRRLEPHEMGPLADYIAALPDANANPALREACLPARRRDPRSGA